MLTPNAVETKGGNWEPIVVHAEREWFPNEHFPRHLRRTKREAIEYAERVIVGRMCFVGLNVLRIVTSQPVVRPSR